MFAGNYKTGLDDADNALTSYYESCVLAGPSLCAIYENTTDLVRARVDRFFDQVRLTPLPLYSDTGSDPTQSTFAVIDYTYVVDILLAMLCDPYSLGEILAEGIASLESGDSTALNQGGFITSLFNMTTAAGSANDSFVPAVALLGQEAEFAVGCGDALVSQLKSVQGAYAEYQELEKASPLFWPHWYVSVGPGGPCA